MADISADLTQNGQRLRRIIEDTTTEVISEDHAVRAVVGPGGAILDLELTPPAFRHSAAELGDLIVDVLRQGRHELERELAQRMATVMGSEATSVVAGMFGSLPTVEDMQRTPEHDQGEEDT
jgi:hypothetical protein